MKQIKALQSVKPPAAQATPTAVLAPPNGRAGFYTNNQHAEISAFNSAPYGQFLGFIQEI